MRKVLSRLVLTAAVTLVAAAPAHGAFTSTYDAGNRLAVMTGDGASDTATFRVVGGVVEHNRAGDPGFASARDFDTGQAGDQTVTDAAISRIEVRGGDGDDVLRAEEPGSANLFWAFSPACVLRDADRPGGGFLLYPGDGAHELELCFGAGTERVEVQGGGGDDRFFPLDTGQGVPVTLDGGAGDDELSTGGPRGIHAIRSTVSFTGGEGDDLASFLDQGDGRATYELAADGQRRQGYPEILLGTGVETSWLYAREGDDTIRVTDSTRQVVVWGLGGDDVVDASATNGRVAMLGFDGDDRLTGGAGADQATGGGGNDVLDGGPGADVLQGGAGDDRLLARDGTRDPLIECGDGADSLTGDELDRIAVDGTCETTDLADAAPSGRGRPLLSSPRLRPSRFAPVAAGRTVTRLGITSSEPAQLTVRFQRRSCRRGDCTYRTVRGSVRMPLAAGRTSVPLDGFVGGRELAAGTYRVLLDARDADGDRARRRTLTATVL